MGALILQVIQAKVGSLVLHKVANLMAKINMRMEIMEYIQDNQMLYKDKIKQANNILILEQPLEEI